MHPSQATGKETDFVIRTGHTTSELIQVTLDTTAPKTMKRELAGIMAAARDLSCSQLTILTGNDIWEKELDGLIVRTLPVWKWLLKQERDFQAGKPIRFTAGMKVKPGKMRR